MAYKTRNIQLDGLSDGPQITTAIYTVLIVVAITGPLLILLRAEPTYHFMILWVGSMVCVVYVMGGIYVRRLFRWFRLYRRKNIKDINKNPVIVVDSSVCIYFSYMYVCMCVCARACVRIYIFIICFSVENICEAIEFLLSSSYVMIICNTC